MFRYRKNGLAGMAEVEQYEAERVKRNKRKAERKRLQEAGLQVIRLERRYNSNDALHRRS